LLKENNTALKMGSEPIYKLVFSMALPPIISLIVQSLYNIVDSIYVSGYSELAFTAVSLAFPIQLLIISIVMGMGVGINSVISRRLGEGDYHGANNAAEHGILIATFLSVFMLLLGIFASEYFYGLFSDDPVLIEYGTIYISIIMIFSVGRMIAQSFISIFQGCGNMVLPMVAQVIGAGVNIILDPILIYGTVFNIRFCDALGIKGAAIATVIGQVSSLVFLIIAFYSKKHVVKLNLSDFKFSKKILKTILVVGIPAAISQGIYSIVVMGLNLILAGISLAAVTTLGAYYKLNSLFLMPIFGVSAGISPICGYNFGAKNYERFKDAVRFGLIYSVGFGVLGMIIFLAIPGALLSIFSLSDEVVRIGKIAFREIGIVFPVSAATIILGSVFQAIGRAGVSLTSSFVRSFVFLLPSAYLLFYFVGVDYGWFAFLSANAFSITFLSIKYKQLTNSFAVLSKV
jgi:putative MATE family efflux protein